MSLTSFDTNNSQTVKIWSQQLLNTALKKTLFSKFVEDMFDYDTSRYVSYMKDNEWVTLELSIGDTIYWNKEQFGDHHRTHGTIRDFNEFGNPLVGLFKTVAKSQITEVRIDWV
jgi:hypothetical protein